MMIGQDVLRILIDEETSSMYEELFMSNSLTDEDVVVVYWNRSLRF